MSVIKVMDFADIRRGAGMMFVKVQAEGPMRGEILRNVEIFRCKVDVSTNEMTIEATGDHGKLEAIISLLQRFGTANPRAPARWPCAAPRRWIDAPPAKGAGSRAVPFPGGPAEAVSSAARCLCPHYRVCGQGCIFV